LRLNIAHDLVRNLADNCDVARVTALGRTVLRLHARRANHRYNLKKQLDSALMFTGI
jgi:hypothetical protein